jgi:hypothetical protein
LSPTREFWSCAFSLRNIQPPIYPRCVLTPVGVAAISPGSVSPGVLRLLEPDPGWGRSRRLQACRDEGAQASRSDEQIPNEKLESRNNVSAIEEIIGSQNGYFGLSAINL